MVQMLTGDYRAATTAVEPTTALGRDVVDSHGQAMTRLDPWAG